jgi:hypothetical protein
VKFYIHPINPHYSATYADDFFAGWQFGIWEHPYPALEPCHYRFQSKHLEAARDMQQQAERANRKLPDAPVKGDWLALPSGVEAFSDTAARTIMAQAALQGRPVKWPWHDSRYQFK